MTHFFETCALCGPRNIHPDGTSALLMRLDREIGWLITQNVMSFRVIPSPGFNFYAALSVLNLKRFFPETELEVLVGNFNNKLKSEDLEVRDFIISHADIVREVRAEPRETAGRTLASALTEDCSYVIAYSRIDDGFCAYVHEHAVHGGKQIILTDKIEAGVMV